MLRLVTAATIAAATALAGLAATATAQQTAPTTPTAPTAPTTPTAPAGPPTLDSLRLPRVVSAQQGHARFLVGVRLSAAAKLTVQVVKAQDGKIVQTATDASTRRAGRAYLRIEGVNDSGFQLLQGPYRLRIQASGAGRPDLADARGPVPAAPHAPARPVRRLHRAPAAHLPRARPAPTRPASSSPSSARRAPSPRRASGAATSSRP